MRGFLAYGASVSAAALALTCTPAFGQTVGGEAGFNDTGEIVVTGRKRAQAEVLQDIPLTATAVTGEALDRALAADLVDVGQMAPGVSFQQSSRKGHANFSIRGMGVSGTSPQDEPTVGIIQDGIFWAVNSGGLGHAFDLEGIEILRGPQGTLFGRNVTGGAVIVNSRRPDFEPSVEAMVGAGSHEMTEASLILNAPLWGDMLAGRLSMMYNGSEGYFENANGGGRLGEELGSIVRGSLLFQPRQDLEILLRAEWYQNEGDPTTVRGVAPGLAANSQPFQDGYRTPANFFAAAPNDRGYNDSDVYMAVLEANWDVGGGTLTFINGIREIRERGFTDYDGLPGTYFHTRGDYNQNQSSSELRYAMQLNDRIGFTLGAYYFESQWISGQNRELSRSTQFLATESRQEQDSFAFFAEGDWNITDRLTLTLGARYTEETKTAATAPFGSCNFDITNCVYGAPDSVSDDDVTPRVALAYELSDNHLLYGSVTRGFRSGGFALRGVPLISPYASEQVTAYEIGSKNDFFDNRLRVNVAGYVNNFTDLQRTTVATDPVAGIVQSTFNAAEATIQGLEVEVDAHVTNNLLLQLSYGYIDATYDSFLGVANGTSRAFVRVPENTLGVSAEYSQPLSNDAELAARLSAYYTDSFFYDDANTLQQDAYTLIDASVGYTAPGGDWSVTLWGKNLTEEEYAHWGANLGALGENYFIGRPRTWGVQLSREF